MLGADGSLVAPWDTVEKLRPGALVAVEANLIVYAFCRASDPSTVRIMVTPSARLRPVFIPPLDVPNTNPPRSSTRRIGCSCDRPPPPRPCVSCEERAERPLLSSLKKSAPCARRQRRAGDPHSCTRPIPRHPPGHVLCCPRSILVQEGYKGQINNDYTCRNYY